MLAATKTVRTASAQNPAGERPRGASRKRVGRSNTNNDPEKESTSPGAYPHVRVDPISHIPPVAGHISNSNAKPS